MKKTPKVPKKKFSLDDVVRVADLSEVVGGDGVLLERNRKKELLT